ncbi:MAG: hypothetical protein JXA83_00335 [Acidimicrobiales bacterium]|nr:hypothetical protein [Acidimicrobiales bacterium]
MPTDRPRHTVTETEEVARALDAAARRWPEDRGRRSRLLQRVVREWARQQDEHEERHREAIRRTSGSIVGLFKTGEREALRDEWPE